MRLHTFFVWIPEHGNVILAVIFAMSAPIEWLWFFAIFDRPKCPQEIGTSRRSPTTLSRSFSIPPREVRWPPLSTMRRSGCGGGCNPDAWAWGRNPCVQDPGGAANCIQKPRNQWGRRAGGCASGTGSIRRPLRPWPRRASARRSLRRSFEGALNHPHLSPSSNGGSSTARLLTYGISRVVLFALVSFFL